MCLQNNLRPHSNFLFLATANGSNVGSNKCTWGPSYWCSGANSAVECGALSYCQSKGLLLDVTTADTVAASPGECKICKLVINAVVEKIGSNATEAKVEEALDQICNHLGGFKGPCETFVTKYTPEIVAVLVNDLNSTSVCIKLGLCPKADGTYQTNGPVECKLCKGIVTKVVANLTSNSTEAEIEQELDKVCDKMGPLAALCADFVEKYTPELIAILANDLNATSICMKIGMCPNSTALLSAPVDVAVSKPSPAECKLCKVVIAQLDLKLNASVPEIEAELDKVCSKLGAFEKVCDDLVTKHVPEIIASLIDGDFNATRVCTKIGLCNATNANDNVADISAALSASSPLSLAVGDTMALGGAIGTQLCVRGPAYWCASKANAEQCNQVAYCQANMW